MIWGSGAAHLVAVAHLVVEFLGFVGLQFLGIGQLGGNVLAGGAGFRLQYPLAILGAAGPGRTSEQIPKRVTQAAYRLRRT